MTNATHRTDGHTAMPTAHRTNEAATDGSGSQANIATGRAADAHTGAIMKTNERTIIVQRGSRTYRVPTPTHGDDAKPSLDDARHHVEVTARERTERLHRIITDGPLMERYGADPATLVQRHDVKSSGYLIGPGTPDRITTDFRLDSIGRMAERDAKAIDRAYVDSHKASIRPVRLRAKRDRTLSGSVAESIVGDGANGATLVQQRTIAVRAGDDDDGSADTIIGRPMHWRDKQIAAATRSARKRDAKRTALDERWHGAEREQIARSGALRLATAIMAPDDTSADEASNDATFETLEPAQQAQILRTLLG